jgi:crotonobetainyl-CoA:carnitine CoA-transferase CaiB-like acyl-CoA transferase
MTDAVSGMLSVLGVLQALYRREQTGLGQAVETDILSAGLLLGSDASLGPDGLAEHPPLDLRQTGLGPYYRLYETLDGWICVVAPDAACRARLHQVLGLTDGPEVAVPRLEAAFRTRSAPEWGERLDAAGVPCEVARDCGTTWYDDPHAVASGWVATYDHPVWGRLEQPGEFVRLSGTPGHIRGAPPLIGQHTEEVLQELGYAGPDIERLQTKGAVGLATSSAPPSRRPRSPSGRP